MTFRIEATVARKIGFASHQNAVPLLRELRIRHDGDTPVEHCTLTLEADPPFLQTKTWRLDRLAPGDELTITERNVELNATLLDGLTESVAGAVHLTLRLDNDDEAARISLPVELLAHNQWGGGEAMAELLAAFVMPNDPAVDHVLKAASDALRSAGKPSDLDGYRSRDRGRAWLMASAIWSAVAGLRLSYALPPASFERHGQKVRTPGAILEGRVATCLDTSLLFASALEQAGLNPLIVMTKGHAFTGVWLQPLEFSTILTDEAAALRRRLDLHDLLVFETTLATNDPPAGFGPAIEAAQRKLSESRDGDFVTAVDVRRARLEHIRPLAVALGPRDTPTGGQAATEGLAEAPALPAFDVEVETEVRTAADRIHQWQQKLLNLTTSNRLLHVPDSAKALRLVCPDPRALEDRLVSGHKVKITPMPDLAAAGRDTALYDMQTQSSLREDVARDVQARGGVLATLAQGKLDPLLVELYRKARTDLEEGGANTLYLVFGFLKWKKSARESTSYRAPLILFPVKLERRSAVSGVVMTHHEDEPRFNLTLLEMLRHDFELRLPGLEGELPRNGAGIDVEAIWQTVRFHIRDIVGFEVVPEVALGTFSFAKYLMWKDLVDRADKLKESPLVRHLIEREAEGIGDKASFPKPERLDAELDPSELFAPLPADSSQLAAVVASARGHSFILDGPPGCGKSQTIANMIAHNLALGRRVLFVSEKRAALEVVQRRLRDKGLGPFCLELHSNKATKAAVLRQLDDAWTTRDAASAEEWAQEAATVRALRNELNDLVRVLHRREANGWTIQRAVGLVVRQGVEHAIRLGLPPTLRHSADDMARLRDIARRLGLAREEVVGLPAAFGGIAKREWSNAWQDDLVTQAAALPGLIEALQQAAMDLQRVVGMPIDAADHATLGRKVDFIRALLDSFGCDQSLAFSPAIKDRIAAAREGVRLVERYRRAEAALSAQYAPEAARTIPIEALQGAWAKACAQTWPITKFAKRKVARDLAQGGGASGQVEPGTDLPLLAELRGLLGQLDGLATGVKGVPGWAGLATDGAAIEAAITRAQRLRAAIAAEAVGPESLATLSRAAASLAVDANELLAPDGAIARAVVDIERAMASYDDGASRFQHLAATDGNATFAVLREQATAVTAHSRRLRDWSNWCRARAEALEASLGPIVDALEAGTIAPPDVPEAFELAYAFWFAATRMDDEPLLRNFAARDQLDRIQRFRDVEDRMRTLASRYIRARICGQIPDKSDAAKRDGFGVLRHQLQLQRAHKPIRQLAADMGEAFTRLAPCMLMSPLSIAQYLPADQALFDLVIFDEASQITPWDAIGAMARGKQVVIAGDPRQMPPSNDFQRGIEGVAGGDGTEPDLASILEEALAAGVPEHSLEWHYRSRHESLITFSNHKYYDGRLVTFPAPDTRPSAVSWVRVPGVWTRGAERTNPIEAREIVAEVVRRLSDPGFVDSTGERLSLGVITMNVEQMRLVENLLDQARQKNPEIEEYFGEDRLEPVVVRNLETAQGDERDVILIGVGFGPTEPEGATMSMNFGKLNAQGGWRRLNVAITRARREMVLFTSFDSGMIDLTRTSQPAISDLKGFIDYARQGPRALAQANRGSVGEAESPFEQAVTAELRQRGWAVVPQVGVSRFRIDIGVVHKDRPGDFLAGVECDGATYHSAATARDRDKVRAAILETLGWHLVRVWSTEWWTDKDHAAAKLHAALEALLEADRPARAAPMPSQAADADTVLGEASRPVPAERDNAARPPAHFSEPIAVAGERVEALVAGATNEAPGSGDRCYRLTDFAPVSHLIDPDEFYEAAYDERLCTIIAHVLDAEAPIVQSGLVQRVARAHGFQRAGRLIRDRVMDLAHRRHHVSPDGEGEAFVWRQASDAKPRVAARFPASEEHVRQIEDIALAELRGAGSNDPVEIARKFGVRRLSAAARARIEAALLPIVSGSARDVAALPEPAIGGSNPPAP